MTDGFMSDITALQALVPVLRERVGRAGTVGTTTAAGALAGAWAGTQVGAAIGTACGGRRPARS